VDTAFTSADTDEYTVTFGTGDDTLDLSAAAADLTGMTLDFSGLDNILHNGDDDVDGDFLTGQAYELQGSGTDTEQLGVTLESAGTYDFSGITANATLALGTGGLEVTNGNFIVTATLTAADDDYTGGTAVDTISAGAGDDTITGGAGADVITGGSGDDTIVLTVIATEDTVTDFTSAASGDVLMLDFSALVTTAGLVLKDGNSATINASTAISLEAVSTATTASAGDEIFVITAATYATSAAMELASESGGTAAITLASASTTGDDYLVLWTDGTDGYFGYMNASSGATTFASASAYTNLVTLTGVSTTTELSAFVAANFAIQS
jgi:hypothetical protein